MKRYADRERFDFSLRSRSFYAKLRLVIYVTVLKIITVLLGVLFTLFGYFILFRKKYSLINGFEADRKAGRKTEAYAKKVGLAEFAAGIALVLTGLLLAIFV